MNPDVPLSDVFPAVSPAPLSLLDSDRLEHQLEEAVTLRQDYESSASKLKTLERQLKTLRLEKEDVHKVLKYILCEHVNLL